MGLLVDIHKDFGAFHLNTSFEVGNETVGLLGASGCGKSITLQCIAGIVTPDRGKIVLDGETLFDSNKKINLPPQKRRIGLMFQNYALFPNMTVEQNILAGMRRSRLDKRAQCVRLASVAKRLHIQELQHHHPHQLSGGQQQRVALARILVSEPRLLMLDEPFSALDSFLRWQTEREVLRVLEQFGGPALLVSHNRDEIYRLCNKVAVYNCGRIDAFDEKWALFRSPKTRTAALLTGCKNIEDARKTRDGRLFVPAWNLTLRTSAPVPDSVAAAGIRAHFLHRETGENLFRCRIEQTIESLFGIIIYVWPEGAERPLCWMLDRAGYAALPDSGELTLSVDPSDILPLC